jgi:hypothetical protein
MEKAILRKDQPAVPTCDSDEDLPDGLQGGQVDGHPRQSTPQRGPRPAKEKVQSPDRPPEGVRLGRPIDPVEVTEAEVQKSVGEVAGGSNHEAAQ